MKTVLVADDSRTSQMLVQGALARLPDVQVVYADDGEQALEVVQGGTPVDLLVTDVNMPGMDGIELVREVRRLRSREQLPIIIITAKADQAARGEGMALGADACVFKPLSRPELVEVAARLLGLGR